MWGPSIVAHMVRVFHSPVHGLGPVCDLLAWPIIALSALGRNSVFGDLVVVIAVLLVAVAGTAGSFPARRAATVDPLATLRYE